MTEARLSPRSMIDLALLGMFWGASFLSIRLALNEVSVLSSVVHRVGWATLILWAVVIAKGLPVPRAPRVWGALLVMGLLNNVIPFTLMAWGQLHIETGLTSILNATTAIFGVLVAALVFRDERLTLRRSVGLGLGFLGVVVIVGREALGSFDIRSIAQLAVLAGTISYALAASWARSQLMHLPPQVAAAGMLTGSTLVMAVLCLTVEGNIDLPQTLQGTFAVGYYAVFATALAYLLYYRIVASAGAGNLSIVTLLIPPIAVVLGWLVLDERLGPEAGIGFALLAAGLLILQSKPHRRA